MAEAVATTGFLDTFRRSKTSVAVAMGGVLLTLAGCGNNAEAKVGVEPSQTIANSADVPSPGSQSIPPSETPISKPDSKQNALDAAAKMLAEYETYRALQSDKAGAEYEYGNVVLLEKLIESESFRREFGICDTELLANQWANNQFLAWNKDTEEFVAKEKSLGAISKLEETDLLFPVSRAKLGAVVINYLLEAGDSKNASCVAAKSDFANKKQYKVAYNGKKYSVKNMSFLGAIRPPRYTGVDRDENAISADGILAMKFDDGTQACDMQTFYAITLGAPPSVFNPDYLDLIKKTVKPGKPNSVTNKLTVQQVQQTYLIEPGMEKLGNVCE